MGIEQLLTPDIVIPLLVGALIAWFLAHHYAVPPQDLKIRQARRYRKTSFASASIPAAAADSATAVDTPFGQYIDNGNGTVSDLRRGLMWVQAPWGMVREGSGFSGEPTELNWWDACELFGRGVVVSHLHRTDEHLQQSRFENGYTKGKCTVAFAGFTDWRLPVAFELNTLGFFDPEGRLEGYEYSGAAAAKTLRETLFPYLRASADRYWLWCANEQGAGTAWAVDGSWPPGEFPAKKQCHVLLVRSLYQPGGLTD